jgi:cytochrome c556
MKALSVIVAGLLGVLPFAAQAQFAKPEDAIKYRKSALSIMGTHFGRLAPVVKGERPFNAAEVAANTAIVEQMSKLPYVAFGPGTDKGADTAALPEVWTNEAKFKSAAENLQKAVVALNDAGKAGNLDQLKVAFGETGKACKACHDDFRKKP